MTRFVIVGPPGAGKSTLARALSEKHGIPILATDDLMATHSWDDAIKQTAEWLKSDGDWIVEGVHSVRALRMWLADNPGELGASVIHLTSAMVPQSDGQRTMGKGIATVWNQIERQLKARSVSILSRHGGAWVLG